MPLAPLLILEGFGKAFLIDVEELVEIPRRALVFLDHQRAEGDRLIQMRMSDAATRLTVHALDLAVLVLVLGDDGGEVAESKFLTEFVADDGPERVEQLTL